MQITQFFLYLAVMAGITYLIRAVPLVLCRGEIKNKYLKSFLAYVPYAVLGAMTFPEILYSTGNLTSGIAGIFPQCSQLPTASIKELLEATMKPSVSLSPHIHRPLPTHIPSKSPVLVLRGEH